MERAQREVVHVLLERVYSQGLISKDTYSRVEDLADSTDDFPKLLWEPVGPAGRGAE